MDRERFKEEFLRELLFFSIIASRDIEKGFTINQVQDSLIKYSSSFYGARLDFDMFASKKACFISENAYYIIQGKLKDDDGLDQLCELIEEEHKVRVKSL